MSSQNAAEPTEASPASRSDAAAGSQEPVARPPQTGNAGSVSAGAENRSSSSPDMVVDDSDASVRTDGGGTKRAGPGGDYPQLESLCRHTAKRRRRDGAAGEEQKQLQASPPSDEVEEPAPFQRLPRELQLLVFSHLSSRELCDSVLPVCRQWRELGRDPVLWQHLSFHGRRCSASTVVSTLASSTLLKTLTLDAWHDGPGRGVALDRILFQAADTCHQLRSLTVTHCERINSLALQAIVERCPLIERVNFKRSRFDSADCISALTGLHNLKALDLFCGPLDEAALLKVVRHCTRLQELNVSGTDMTDAGVQELVAHAGDRLLSLQLYARHLTDAGYGALDGCRTLQTLCMWRPYKMTDVSLPALAGLHDLRRLEIRGGDEVSAAALARLFAGQNMPQLVKLSLSECENVDDETVDALTSNCPQLTALDLSYSEITDTGLEMIVTRLHCLRELNLSRCMNVDDETVDALTANCPRLSVLDLSSNSGITSDGLKLIGTRLHCLRELNLSECGNVDDATVDALTTNCPQLTVLNLTCCFKITDAGLEMIVTRLHCLRKLYLRGVPGITRTLIPARLRYPYLGSCAR